MTRRGRKGNQGLDSETETFKGTGGEMKERPNAICNETIQASTEYSINMMVVDGGEGERRRLLRRQKRRASGASLILPNMGCTRQYLAPPWENYPFPFFYFVLVILSFSVWNIIFFLSFSLILSQFLQSLHLSSTPSVTLGTDLGVATQISKLHILLHIPLHVTGSVDFCQIKICTTFNVRMPRETIVAKLSRLFRLI